MRPLRFLRFYVFLGLAYLAALAWFSLSPRPLPSPDLPHGDKWGHLLAYGLLMAWWGQLVQRPGLRWGLGLFFVVFGAWMELLQGLSGFRNAEWTDALANMTGVVLGAWLTRYQGGQWLERLEQSFFR